VDAVRVEPARLRDALATLALQREVLAEGRFFVTGPQELRLTIEEREREIRILGEADNSCFLVARLPDARVAGFLTVNGGGLQRTRHVGRLEVMVAAPHRRRGVGKALVSAALGWAEGNAVIRKLSLVVLADNVGAVALYRSAGFVEEGRRVGEYREPDGTLRDDVLMAYSTGS
jgi:ribosomal protein S18 acetylase RimI-like enzyme